MSIFKKKMGVLSRRICHLSVANFLIDWLCSGLSLRRSIIGGLVGGVLMTILFWFFDQGFAQIRKSSKQDKSEE